MGNVMNKKLKNGIHVWHEESEGADEVFIVDYAFWNSAETMAIHFNRKEFLKFMVYAREIEEKIKARLPKDDIPGQNPIP